VKERVALFWDNSNIFIPTRHLASQRDGAFADPLVRVHFKNLYRLARAGREVVSGACVGSVPPEEQALWDQLRSSLEAEASALELYERGEQSGREQGVDQCLQVHMLRALADVQPPAVAVLLTGDGTGYEQGAGYHADLERLHKAGWGIELLSWDISCNKRLKAWAQSVGVYVPLESYYTSVTFIKNGRRSTPLSLKSRPHATPKSVT
jgi:hypothetical protein